MDAFVEGMRQAEPLGTETAEIKGMSFNGESISGMLSIESYGSRKYRCLMIQYTVRRLGTLPRVASPATDCEECFLSCACAEHPRQKQ